MGYHNKNETDAASKGAKQNLQELTNCANGEVCEAGASGYDYVPGRVDPYLIVILSQL